jgi:uncharacterized protein YbcI
VTSPDQTLRGGALNAAISKEIVGILSEYIGKGPPAARAIHCETLVLCILEDTLTKAERTLVTAGKGELVLQTRQAFQDTMRSEMSDSVEALTGRKVVAFMSANHIDPDLAVEVFMLDSAIVGDPEVSDGRRSSA